MGKSAGFRARLLGFESWLCHFLESYRIPQTSLWEVLIYESLGMAGAQGPRFPAQEAAWPSTLSCPHGARIASALCAVHQPGRSVSLPRRQKDLLSGPYPAAELGMGASPSSFLPSWLKDKAVCVIMCRGLRSLVSEAHCPCGTSGPS